MISFSLLSECNLKIIWLPSHFAIWRADSTMKFGNCKFIVVSFVVMYQKCEWALSKLLCYLFFLNQSFSIWKIKEDLHVFISRFTERIFGHGFIIVGNEFFDNIRILLLEFRLDWKRSNMFLCIDLYVNFHKHFVVVFKMAIERWSIIWNLWSIDGFRCC